MTELEVKETLSRLTDLLNHIDAHHTAFRAEIDSLKLRVEKLEEQK
ncbi:MAG: hypothetical protein ACYTBJ_06200 [Planctomycetota bacterium]|jgi:hypothetical protein